MKTHDYDFIEFNAWQEFGEFPKAKNDCSVLSLAILFDIHYDKAQKITKMKGREHNKGFWLPDINFNKFRREMNKTYYGKNLFEIKLPVKKLTLSKFPHIFPLGRYIAYISNHYISFVDGIAIGSWKPKSHKLVKRIYGVK